MEAALRHIQATATGVTLNSTKCQFRKVELKFLGHLMNDKGIQPDPDKTAAIIETCPPTCIQELKRFMAMVNHLGKFYTHLEKLSQPLCELLTMKNLWRWDSAQDQAFKTELSKPTVLALYDVNADMKISADASSSDLGAVLLQRVIYASRAITSTECSYAQVEKEALATTWACKKFASCILGKKFTIETDHKPLVLLLGNKSLHSLPPRILHFQLRLHALSMKPFMFLGNPGYGQYSLPFYNPFLRQRCPQLARGSQISY